MPLCRHLMGLTAFSKADTQVGFAWTIRLIALICGVLGIASFFLLKTRLPPKPAGSFFYLQAFKNPQYTMTVLNFFVRSRSSLVSAGPGPARRAKAMLLASGKSAR